MIKIQGKKLIKYLTEKDIPQDIVRKLEIEYRNWGMEDGNFFDGKHFRD